MTTSVDQVRLKIDAVEAALEGSGMSEPYISRGAKAAGVELTHRAILDCLKAMAEALEELERRSAPARQ